MMAVLATAITAFPAPQQVQAAAEDFLNYVEGSEIPVNTVQDFTQESTAVFKDVVSMNKDTFTRYTFTLAQPSYVQIGYEQYNTLKASWVEMYVHLKNSSGINATAVSGLNGNGYKSKSSTYNLDAGTYTLLVNSQNSSVESGSTIDIAFDIKAIEKPRDGEGDMKTQETACELELRELKKGFLAADTSEQWYELPLDEDTEISSIAVTSFDWARNQTNDLAVAMLNYDRTVLFQTTTGTYSDSTGIVTKKELPESSKILPAGTYYFKVTSRDSNESCGTIELSVDGIPLEEVKAPFNMVAKKNKKVVSGHCKQGYTVKCILGGKEYSTTASKSTWKIKVDTKLKKGQKIKVWCELDGRVSETKAVKVK